MTAKKILRKTGKVLAWIIASILILILLVYILIQIPAVQNFAKNKVVAYLEKKIGTKVKIDKLSLSFPKRLVLEGVYFEDQKKDTLLSANKLQVDIALLKLINSKVEINYVELDGINANIYRLGKDTLFNYDYIVKAFVSPPSTEPTDTSASSMQFKVEKIVLNNIHARFKDDQTGNDADIRLGNFETGFKTFDPTKSIYNLPKISLSGIRATVKQYKPLMEPKPMAAIEQQSNEPFQLDLKLGTIDLKDIKFDYDNSVSALAANLDLGALSADIKNINLQTLLVQLNKVQLDSTRIKLKMGKSELAKAEAEEIQKQAIAQANNPWKVELGKLVFNNDEFQYDDDNKPAIDKGFDPGHMHIKGLTVDANNLSVTPTEYMGNLAQLSFMEKGGLDLQELHTDFYYGEKQAYLKNLLLKTPGTTIRDNITLQYPSAETMATNPGEILLNASLNQASISVKDILTLMPTMAQTPGLKGNEMAVFKINGNVKGYLKDLQIPSLQLSGIGNTSLGISGTIKGLPDPNKTYFDLNIAHFNTTKADLLKFIPKGSVPENVRIPETIAINGLLKGTTSKLNTIMHLRTNKGNIDLSGSVNTNNQTYDIATSLQNVDAGYLLKQDTVLGKINMKLKAKGSGFDMKKANAVVSGQIASAYIKGYNYTNLDMDATIKKGQATANAKMHDRNIGFNLVSSADLTKKFPAVKMNLKIDTLNLKALKIIPGDYTLNGDVVADFPVTNPDSLIGTVSINNLVFIDSGRMYRADSITLAAEANGVNRKIKLQSQLAELQLDGQYRLTEIGTALQKTINQYYTIPGFKDTTIAPQNWTLYAKIIPSEMLYQFAPQLKGSDTMRLDMSYNSSQNDMDVIFRAPKIVFGDQKIDSLTLTANTNAGKLDYALTINKAGSPSFAVNRTSVSGDLANNVLNTNIDVKDAAGKSRFQLGAMANQIPNGVKLSLKPELLLDYQPWAAGTNNYIQYDAAGVVVNNFTISNQNQSLSINSTTPSPTSPIDVKFDNFSISTLTSFAGQKDLLVGGVINGSAQVKDVMVSPVFTSDLTIKDLSYKADTLGNILVKVDNQTANAYNASVKLEGNGNDVQLNGKYYTGEGKMDLKLDINNLNLASIKKFSAGQLQDASGAMKGSIAVKGTLDRPNVIGDVRFEKAYITPTMLGERFFLSNEAITVATRDIIFDNFTLVDSSGNKAVIDGNIYTNNFEDFRFDMDFSAKNFRAVNSAKQPGKMFYGKLNMDADVSIRGTVGAPTVKGSLKVNKETNFVVVLPSEDPEIMSRDGVVRFIDYSAPKDTAAYAAMDSALNQSELKGIDLQANIETDTAAQFTMVIDERSGDALAIRGKADLAAAMDRSGKISLTGNYEVQGGSYNLSFNFLKRRFEIQKGSIITWTGDPTSANVDITAVYIANTAPIDLVQSQMASQSQSDINRYKQKLPFNVYLKMNGELMKPVISFDIDLPEDKQSEWKDVVAKLEQVRRDDAEMNKQVFALLLLGRFVAENPFQSSGGSTSAESMVRQSASRLLTEQLNQLAGNLIKGVDLNFGVSSEDDYSSGEKQSRTDLNVGVSKRLLNDRLKVSVGSNFELEGPSNANQATSNIAGDVTLDYQLSKDGRYLLRAYRRNKYEGVVEGQVVETGMSFVFTLDYDQLKELFNKTSDSEAKNQEKLRKIAEEKAKKDQKEREKLQEEKRKDSLEAAKKDSIDSRPAVPSKDNKQGGNSSYLLPPATEPKFLYMKLLFRKPDYLEAV